MPCMQIFLRGRLVIYDLFPVKCEKRWFFASSTDHTTLLKFAQVHCLNEREGVHRYVMAAEGIDFETVAKVPQLHLARLDRKDNLVFGAKVINRTLGTPAQVCGKLLDRALQDMGSEKGAQARSTLHGLSAWVIRGLQKDLAIDTLSQLRASELEAIAAIARGEAGAEAYDVGRASWEQLIVEFVEKGLGEEAELYLSKGGGFLTVEHHSDQSEYADTSAGSMALFSL
jgi:hypothetical protein